MGDDAPAGAAALTSGWKSSSASASRRPQGQEQPERAALSWAPSRLEQPRKAMAVEAAGDLARREGAGGEPSSSASRSSRSPIACGLSSRGCVALHRPSRRCRSAQQIDLSRSVRHSTNYGFIIYTQVRGGYIWNGFWNPPMRRFQNLPMKRFVYLDYTYYINILEDAYYGC